MGSKSLRTMQTLAAPFEADTHLAVASCVCCTGRSDGLLAEGFRDIANIV